MSKIIQKKHFDMVIESTLKEVGCVSEDKTCSTCGKDECECEKTVAEDSESEETYNYGEDEGHDKEVEDGLEDEEKMEPADRVKEIGKHVEALKKDMSYDEDHEDRDEPHTHFESVEESTEKLAELVVGTTKKEFLKEEMEHFNKLIKYRK